MWVRIKGVLYNLALVQSIDFDHVSHYSSSMYRMNGYLKGVPKVIQSNQLYYDFLKQQSGYFIKIKLNKVGVNRQFPLLSKKNENDVRVFRNDLVDEEGYLSLNRPTASVDDSMNESVPAS